MRHAFTSSLLSLLLLVTLVWGGCVSCEEYFMLRGAKSCCSPTGHCKPQPSPSQNSDRECKQIAVDVHKAVDFHFDLPAITVAQIELPVLGSETPEHWRTAPIDPTPPDLQVLHSTFRI